jgi:BMFP domain-containing protein YqiC
MEITERLERLEARVRKLETRKATRKRKAWKA